jgi:hypothetical protein
MPLLLWLLGVPLSIVILLLLVGVVYPAPQTPNVKHPASCRVLSLG